MAKGGKRPGAGRPPGTPNKATADVRAAFSALLQGNVKKLNGWLSRVGKEDPARALDLVIKLAEYHIPKLSRTEVTGPQGGPVQIVRKYFGKQPPSEQR
jgi:hypothetical protein